MMKEQQIIEEELVTTTTTTTTSKKHRRHPINYCHQHLTLLYHKTMMILHHSNKTNNNNNNNNNRHWVMFIVTILTMSFLFIVPCCLLVWNWNQLLQNIMFVDNNNNDNNNNNNHNNNHYDLTSKVILSSSSSTTTKVLFHPMSNVNNNDDIKNNDINNDNYDNKNNNNTKNNNDKANKLNSNHHHHDENDIIDNEGIDNFKTNDNNDDSSRNDIRSSNTNLNIPYCTREQIRHGQWLPMIYSQPPYLSKTKHLRCPPIYHYYENNNNMMMNTDPSLLLSSSSLIQQQQQQQHRDVINSIVDDGGKVDDDDYMNITEWHTYDWVPYNSILTSYDNGHNNMIVTPYHDGTNNKNNDVEQKCIFLRWNTTDFCNNILPTGTISIIGDSLSWEQYSSLLQLVGQKVKQTSQFTSKNHYTNHIQYGCYNTDKTTLSKFIYRNLSKPNGTSVQHSIDEDFPFIIVLNRGAHYVNDTMVIDDMLSIIDVIETWQNKCKTFFNITCYFFYRTTVPGHSNCSNFTKPYNDYNTMKDYTENMNHYDINTTEYHWYDFHYQNQIILNLLSKSSINYYILDAYDIAILRPDKHRYYQGDCLHNCYPGTMDIYNQLLYHYLKMIRPIHEIQRITQIILSHQQPKQTASKSISNMTTTGN